MDSEGYIVSYRYEVEPVTVLHKEGPYVVVRDLGKRVSVTDTKSVHSTRYEALNAAHQKAFTEGMEKLDIARKLGVELLKAFEPCVCD